MEIFFTKDKRKSTDFAKLFGGAAALALVLQLTLGGFFSLNSASAQVADASLTVNKVVVGGTNVVGDFALFVDGMPVTSGVATTTLEAGVHTITETNLPGYTATFSGDCNADGEVTLTAGGTAECTITNTFATTTATTTSLTVTKVVVGGTATTSDFDLFVNDVPVTNGVATTTLGAGVFTITESNLPGYTASFSGDCNAAGMVALTLGTEAECVITNTFSTTTATSSPTLTLEGDEVINIFICNVEDGEMFVDPGFSAVDSTGATTTATSTGTVDLTTAGTYTITYTATDSEGNTATTTRTVNVLNCSSGGGGGGQTNRGIERAAAVTPPGTAIAGQGLGLNTFQTFFLPPGQVLGAQSQFRGQVLGAQSYIPGMPSTGAEPLDSLKMFLGVMVLAGVVIMSYPHAARMFSRKN